MRPSRRDFIASVLGTPIALAACRESAEPPLPDGVLLTPGKAMGHRLRDVLPPGDAPIASFQQADVVIVGAGAAGLSASWWLKRNGIESVTLDLDTTLGGTAQFGQAPCAAYPWGAHYIVEPTERQPELVELLREVGALEPGQRIEVAEHIRARDPAERVYYRGRWHSGLYLHEGSSAEDAEQLARFRREIGSWVRFRDEQGRRAFDLPLCEASEVAPVRQLDQLSFAQWLDGKGLTSERLRWLTDYSCRDDYGLREVDTSAWAGVGYFAARMNEPQGPSRPVATWPAGNGRLVSHLATATQLRLEHAVYDVRQSAEGVEVRAVTPSGLVGVRARRAIFAAPLALAKRVVEPLRRGARVTPVVDKGAWAVVNLHLKDRPRVGTGVPLAWDNVIRDSPSLGYVVATHQLGVDHGPTVLTWYYPFTGNGAGARRQLEAAGRDEWVSAALSDIARAHPDIRSLCQRADAAYWGHAMPRPRVGAAFDPALREAREPLGAIHFASSELSSVALFEEAFAHGVRAAREVSKEWGRGPA